MREVELLLQEMIIAEKGYPEKEGKYLVKVESLGFPGCYGVQKKHTRFCYTRFFPANAERKHPTFDVTNGSVVSWFFDKNEHNRKRNPYPEFAMNDARLRRMDHK